MTNNRDYKNNLKAKITTISFLFFSPIITFAATTTSSASCTKPTDIGSIFDYARCIISNSIIPFLIGLGVLIFLVGVVQYIAAGDNEEKRTEGRNLIIFGIIAIFVMVSVWGLVNILVGTFNLNNSYPGSSSQTTTGAGVDLPSGPSTGSNPIT